MTLIDEISNLVLDCDGVVFVGDHPVDGTAELASAARGRGLRLLFVTNEANHSAEMVAARIRGTGVDATAADVLHAGQAAAMHLVHSGRRRALVLGTEVLAAEIAAAGVDAVRTAACPDPASGWDALVVGSDPDLSLADFHLMLQAWRPGMELVAVNGDRSFPAHDGLHVGSGALAAAVAYAVGTEVVVAGKPSRILFEEAAARLAPGRTAMVGDNVESDVAGANRAGWTSIWLRRPGAPAATGIEPDFVVTDPRQVLDL